MQAETLAVFIPTFFFVSVTPGLCMTLALTLGMSIGLKRSLPMMWGELLGVGLVATLGIVGIAAMMLQFPKVFLVFKIIGGLYLAWIGIEMWRSRGRLAIPETPDASISIQPWDLALRGFITAVSNPKGWAFLLSLLPPFIDHSRPIGTQLVLMLTIVLTMEFGCLLAYASGGQALRHLLLKQGNVRLLNRITGSLMIAIGIWLILN
ncbi:LysE family translocator [uncultured Thiothrix sp.]|uniref:LysE family translocator n=1 Tax=uncultured Thiothrix sp. TaxID=223185 RepID=UPI00261325BC|nr:LysE family translocator [uncultured Thiothrix sp.]HMT93957.1 LysE family translocator [Thiolinea sp.]